MVRKLKPSEKSDCYFKCMLNIHRLKKRKKVFLENNACYCYREHPKSMTRYSNHSEKNHRPHLTTIRLSRGSRFSHWYRRRFPIANCRVVEMNGRRGRKRRVEGPLRSREGFVVVGEEGRGSSSSRRCRGRGERRRRVSGRIQLHQIGPAIVIGAVGRRCGAVRAGRRRWWIQRRDVIASVARPLVRVRHFRRERTWRCRVVVDVVGVKCVFQMMRGSVVGVF